MAYHTKWRRQNGELLAMARSSSDSEDHSFVSAQAGVCATINSENFLREDCAGSRLLLTVILRILIWMTSSTAVKVMTLKQAPLRMKSVT